MKIKAYVNQADKNLFENWFSKLESNAIGRVATALSRMKQGNLSNVKSVGGGVLEYKINFGKGIRIYFGRDGDALIILLCGGDKHRQQKDINIAKRQWAEYKSRKKSQTL